MPIGDFERQVLRVIAANRNPDMAEVGCLYLDGANHPVRPNPGSPVFPRLKRHFGSVKGAWPRVVGQ